MKALIIDNVLNMRSVTLFVIINITLIDLNDMLLKFLEFIHGKIKKIL